MTEKTYCTSLKNNSKIFAPLLALSMIAASIMMTVTILQSSQEVHGQNATGQNFTMQIENATAIDQVSSDVLSTLAAPGWANKYDVLVDGKPTPINYNIIGGQLVGMLANPDRDALYLAINPSSQSDGGAVEVQLPRNFIDSKASDNTDKPYVVVMDGDRISGEPTGICIGDCPNIFNTFTQTAESGDDRVLTVVFGPESRFLEIIGSKGA